MLFTPDNSDGILLVYESPDPRELSFEPRLHPKSYGRMQEAGVNPHVTFAYKPRQSPGKTANTEAVERINAAIAESQAKVVVGFGAAVSKLLKLGAKITQVHGSLTERDGVHYMPSLSEGFAFRYPERAPDLARDLDRAVAIYLEGPTNDDIDWKVVQKSNVVEFFEDLDRCKEFAFDLETSGLNWFESDGYITCLGIAIEDHCWIVPLTRPRSPFLTPEMQIRVMDLIFDTLGAKPGIAQNGKFDQLWLKSQYGRTFNLAFDTLLAHYAIDENSPHGLKVTSRKYLGAPDYDLTTKEKKGGVTNAKLYEYCARDCLYTLQLKQIFKRELNKDLFMRRIFNELLMPASGMFVEVDSNGLFIDMELFQTTRQQVSRELRDVRAKLDTLAGRDVNWNSPSQVGELLFGDLKLKATVKTAKGAWSTGEEALLALKGQHEIIDVLFKYRELEKFRSTYLDGWLAFMANRRVFFSTKIHGTVTGRFSSRLHQVPRDGTIRHLVTAPKGWTFFQADFSQAELRVAAILSEDRELIRCYREGIDVHWKTFCDNVRHGGDGKYVKAALQTGSELAGKKVRDLGKALDLMERAGHRRCIEIDSGWKEGRKKAKGINFGLLYGQSAPGLQRYLKTKFQIEMTPEEALAAHKAFFKTYRSLEGWHKAQVRAVNRDREVVSLMGRRRRLPHIKSPVPGIKAEAERQAINSPVQGFIGDLKAAAMIEAHRAFPRDELRLVGEVHDSILGWVRDGHHKRLEELRQIMESPSLLKKFNVNLTVPIVADIEIGPWGNGVEI